MAERTQFALSATSLTGETLADIAENDTYKKPNMGLFDKIKSKEQLAREASMQKMQSSIFPGGKEQIQNELRQIRTLLDFRYTQDETYKTYMHAVAVYFFQQPICHLPKYNLEGKLAIVKYFYNIYSFYQIYFTNHNFIQMICNDITYYVISHHIKV